MFKMLEHLIPILYYFAFAVVFFISVRIILPHDEDIAASKNTCECVLCVKEGKYPLQAIASVHKAGLELHSAEN